MGIFKKGGVKKIVKNTKKNVKKKADKVKKNIQKQINKIKLKTSEIPFKILLPFKPAMVNALNRKKIAHNGTLNDVAVKFLNNIAKKNKSMNFLNGGELYLPSENYLPTDNFETLDHNFIDPVTIGTATAIITGIINWFKERKARKEAGEKLDVEDEAILSDAEAAANAMQEQAENEAEGSFEVFGMSVTNILLTVIGVIVAIKAFDYFFGKKTSKA